MELPALLVLLTGRDYHFVAFALAVEGFLFRHGALHGADGVVPHAHQAETLLWRELAYGIALDGAVGEVEFCYHCLSF